MSIILTAAKMRAADEKTIADGTPSQVLMERAARAALAVLEERFDTAHTLILCGSGNNGGDGFAMARFLAEQGKKVSVFYLGKRIDGTPDTDAMSVECARQYGLLPPAVTLQDVLLTDGVTAVVDAVFGIGLCRPIEGEIAEVLRALAASAIPVLALDIPSGIHADNGQLLGTALPAKVTVAIAAAKWGHYLYPGAHFCGEIVTVDIGIHADAPNTFLVRKSDLSALPTRPARAHKGTFGRVLVIGGSVGMSGAGYFAAKAALRAGAGLVELFAPHDNRIIYQTQLPEALLTLYDPEKLDEAQLIAAIKRADAIAIGMGLGQNDLTYQLLALVLEHSTVPTIIDADALNVLSLSPALRELCQVTKSPKILTPHLGEASRLLSQPVPTIAQDLPRFAKQLSTELCVVAALKDARTVISDKEHAYLNTYGNSGMATGGSGDVLAGVIASFAAQGANATDAARLGVAAHALAGDAALQVCGNHGLMASDIIEGLCRVLD